MSIEPADTLVSEAAESEVLAAAIEAHLDEHPLPVDADEVDQVAARVERRIRARRRRLVVPWVVLGVLAMAAAAVVALRGPAPEPVGSEALRSTAATIQVGPVDEVHGPLVEHEVLVLDPDAEVLRSQHGATTVLLVREGAVRTPAEVVPAEHWVLTTEVDGAIEQVVFPDGQAPPPLHEDVWPETVEAQLRSVRWRALPPETLETLDILLEAP